MSSNSGKLWIVATPLGNPGDLSPRAREILTSATFVLAEDTRRTGALFAACGIVARHFVSLHEHNEKQRLSSVMAELGSGAVAALVSDAGTPLISDPGYLLVRACRKEGIPVSPVPGPASPITALSASGLPPLPFVFLGFLPRTAGDIRKCFMPYASLHATLIFFERKDRLAATLALAHEVLGDREGCIARELTKTYEEFIPFALDAATKERFDAMDLLGELTVLLGPPQQRSMSSQDDVRAAILEQQHLAPHAKPREIARRVQRIVTGWSVDAIYALLRQGR